MGWCEVVGTQQAYAEGTQVVSLHMGTLPVMGPAVLNLTGLPYHIVVPNATPAPLDMPAVYILRSVTPVRTVTTVDDYFIDCRHTGVLQEKQQPLRS